MPRSSSRIRRFAAQRAPFVVLTSTLFACSGQHGSAALAPPDEVGGTRVAIEESDIYRRDGSLLFIQNADTGLNIVDIADAAAPRRLGRAAVRGTSGELYVHRGYALVLLKSTSACSALPGLEAPPWPSRAELQIVDARDPRRPVVQRNVCLPGQLVASRLVGDQLVLVTRHDFAARDGGTARVFTLTLEQPAYPLLADAVPLRGVSKEIHVTLRRVYVAGASDTTANQTRVELIDIDASTGKLARRGRAFVAGEPQGRFHMDEYDDTFRIVTYDASLGYSRLSVLDVADADHPVVVGALGGLGRNERLFATRFDGDKAYIVTFRQTDPLWIVSLSDPSSPKLLGELVVPGYSDFIFPRGDRLLAVGHTRLNQGVQVSLFDVSNPHAPRALTQLTLGDAYATSEANRDHRAVTIVESGEMGSLYPLVVLPYARSANTTTYNPETGAWDYAGCNDQRIAILELEPARLSLRGEVRQLGLVRRTLAVDGTLLGIGELTVSAFDLRDLEFPLTLGEAIVGSSRALSCSDGYALPSTPTTTNWNESMPIDRVDSRRMFCQSIEGVPAAVPLVVVGFVLLALRARRRARIPTDLRA